MCQSRSCVVLLGLECVVGCETGSALFCFVGMGLVWVLSGFVRWGVFGGWEECGSVGGMSGCAMAFCGCRVWRLGYF